MGKPKNKKPKNKKTNNESMFKIILVIIAILLVLAGVFLMTFRTNEDSLVQNSYFNPNRAALGTRLFEELMEFSIYNYPETIEGVMEEYLKTVQLLYGDMIVNQELIMPIIEVQRKMFSDEILQNNSIESQHQMLTVHLEELKENDIRLLSSDIRLISQDVFNSNVFNVNIVQQYTTIGTVNVTYRLERDNANRWKIAGWEISY
jgi:hypothetical protein